MSPCDRQSDPKDFPRGGLRLTAFRLLSNASMMLSAEALDIVSYLKTAQGTFVSLAEVSRRAGGRQRFQDTPDWAKNLMSTLVDAGMIEVNARGHYRVPPARQPQSPARAAVQTSVSPSNTPRGTVVGDDYFPVCDLPKIVAGDYFPSSE